MVARDTPKRSARSTSRRYSDPARLSPISATSPPLSFRVDIDFAAIGFCTRKEIGFFHQVALAPTHVDERFTGDPAPPPHRIVRLLENRRAFGDIKDTSPKNCIQPVTRVETRQLFLKTRLEIYRKMRELIILKKDGIRSTFCSVLIFNGASCYVFSRNFSYQYQEPPDLLTHELTKIKSSFVNSLESPSDAENCETISAFSKRYRSGEFGLRTKSDHVQPQKKRGGLSWIGPLSTQNTACSRDSLPTPQCSNLWRTRSESSHRGSARRVGGDGDQPLRALVGKEYWSRWG